MTIQRNKSDLRPEHLSRPHLLAAHESFLSKSKMNGVFYNIGGQSWRCDERARDECRENAHLKSP